MKGRYNGCQMSVYGSVIPHGARLARCLMELSPAAKQRLKWFDYYVAHGRNARLTCRYFGISPQTFYRWKGRYDPRDLQSLASRSRRPQRVRQTTASLEVVTAVLRLRQQYPRWGKDKLVVLLRPHGYPLSTSMVGRILGRLKARGVLVESPRGRGGLRRRAAPRTYAIRKPRGYTVTAPGDLVQVDTLDVQPLPGMTVKHFGGRDMISRWDVVEVHARATSTAAGLFLDSLQARMPFGVKALQVDGGSEYAGEFEEACRQRGIHLFVLPPRSPKLNGQIERAHRTHQEEFYEVAELPWTIQALNVDLRTWEDVYNTIRPHQALHYLTPAQFLAQWHATHLGKENVSPK